MEKLQLKPNARGDLKVAIEKINEIITWLNRREFGPGESNWGERDHGGNRKKTK